MMKTITNKIRHWRSVSYYSGFMALLVGVMLPFTTFSQNCLELAKQECAANDNEFITKTLDASGSLVLTVDRKSTRLNSSHVAISYAVFCLKKKKTKM